MTWLRDSGAKGRAIGNRSLTAAKRCASRFGRLAVGENGEKWCYQLHGMHPQGVPWLIGGSGLTEHLALQDPGLEWFNFRWPSHVVCSCLPCSVCAGSVWSRFH